jgi:hypothetical protein
MKVKILLLLLFLSFGHITKAFDYYVDSSRAVSGNGLSWGQAFKTLKEATDLLLDPPRTYNIIHIAKGTYYPTGDKASSDRNASFVFTQYSTEVYGGYPSGGGQRDIVANPTILSGEINNPNSLLDNSFHVVMVADLPRDQSGYIPIFKIDGVTIQGGRANGSGQRQFPNVSVPYNSGGGIVIETYNRGAGSQNNVTISNCKIIGNYASDAGAGIYNSYSNLVINNCLISGNYANYGGGLLNYGTPAKINNCTFAGNYDNNSGGAIRNSSSNSEIKNTIIYGNSSGVSNNNSSPSYWNSLVQGLAGGSNGNLNGTSNPLFTSPIAPGTVNINGDYSIGDCGSPVVNMGNNNYLPSSITKDLAGKSRRNSDGVVDLGAYEFIGQRPGALAAQSFCGAATLADISVVGTAIKWYANLTDATSLPTNTTLNHGYFYVSQTITGCVESDRYPIFVYRNPSTIYVNQQASGNGDGTNWANAIGDLQQAINLLCNGGEVWVAAGTYKPNRPANNINTISATNRNNAFVLRKEVKILGGFPNTGNPALSDRNWVSNPTILSGDIGVEGDPTDNAYHVVVAAGDVSGALLDGFTITKGRTGTSGEGSITVNGVSLLRERGGGVALASATVSHPTITNTIFRENYGYAGSAISSTNSSAIVTNSLIVKNTSDFSAIYNNNASPQFVNVTIADNVAYNSDLNGTGVRSISSSKPEFYNTVIWNNKNASGALDNFTNNGGSIPEYYYSIVQGSDAGWATIGFDGGGNMDQNPLFLSATNHMLSNCSPAINHGRVDTVGILKPSTYDLGRNNRIANTTIDIGAYEFTGSISPKPTSVSIQSFCDKNLTLANIPIEGVNVKWYSAKVGGVNLPTSTVLNTGKYYASQTLSGVCESQRTEIYVHIEETPIYTRYVREGAVGNGTSWADASGDLQLMINMVCDNGQVWVAAGTYKPIHPANDLLTIDPNNRNNAFVLRKDIKLLGGFPPTGNPTLADRNVSLYGSILSGDLGVVNDISDNAYHVVIASNNIGNGEINGFTISGGNAEANNYYHIMVNGYRIDGTYGGGLSNNKSSPKIVNCIFSGNIAKDPGAGLCNFQSSPQIINCVFSGNRAKYGGGIWGYYSNANIVNSTFSGNIATTLGGAIDNYQSNITIRNSIIFGNSSSVTNRVASTINISYSIVQGGYAGTGNLDISPKFIHAPAFSLAPFTHGDYQLAPCSPAIDKGLNSNVPAGIGTDLAGKPRIFNNAVVDMGAYEYQAVPGVSSPTATATQSFCGLNYTIADLKAAGSEIKWYDDSSGGSALHMTYPLRNGSFYVSQTINGCESPRARVTVYVGTIPPEPTATTTQSFCGSSTIANLVATGPSYANIKWYLFPSGGTPLPTNTSISSRNYYVSQFVGHCESAKKAVAVTVNPVPPSPTVNSPQLFCGSGTVANLIATGNEIKWYNVATGGAALATNASLSSGSYFVSQTISGCESPRATVTVTVNAIPAAPTATAVQSFCGSSTIANLVATGSNIRWYNVSSGGSALTTSTLISTRSYYASQTVNGCESPRRTVNVSVNAVPAAPTASAQSFCGSSTIANLVATGSNIRWYNVTSGGSALSTNTSISSRNYYASQTVNGCESPRATVAVTVNAIPAAPTATAAQNFCGSNTVANLTAIGSGIKWYNVLTGGTALSSSASLAAGIYYASQTINGCEGPRATVTVTVNAIPAAPTATAVQALCSSNTIANLTATGSNIKWYNVSTGGMAIASNTSIGNGNYYSTQTVNNCESPRTQVAVYVNPNRYVKAGASGNGLSWAEASGDLQLMMNEACPNTEIWVAAGTYNPNRAANSLDVIDENNINNAFVLAANVKIYGGFPSSGSPSFQDRNWTTNTTILSGDLGVLGSYDDNARHVVVSSGNVGAALLDGFTIVGGNTGGSNTSSLTVKGTGVVYERGGGIALSASSPTIRNIILKDNKGYAGAGISMTSSSPILMNVLMHNNLGDFSTLYTNASSPIIMNCTITDNRAPNTSNNGVAVRNTSSSTPKFYNSIIWNNLRSDNVVNNITVTAGTPYYSNCLIQGINSGATISGTRGIGNLDVNPRFVNAIAGNYNLEACSPAIDAGSDTVILAGTNTDLLGADRKYKSGVIDIGAYEYQADLPPLSERLAINLDAASTTVTNAATLLASTNACRQIATVVPNGASPVAGLINAKVWVDATVQTYKVSPYVQRHYELTPSINAASSTARITLYFTQSEFDAFNIEAAISPHLWLPAHPNDAVGRENVRVYQFSGTSSDAGGLPESYASSPGIIKPASEDVVWNAPFERWEVSFNVTGFSGFFLSSASSSVLPVKLLSFSGKLAEETHSAHLQWQVVNQQSIKEYVIERSVDGKQFIAAGTTIASSSSSEMYSFVDPITPLLTNHNSLYYRIRIVNADGKYTISKTIVLSATESSVRVYPSPARNEVWLNGGTGILGKGGLLLDMQGKVLQKITIVSRPQRINTSGLASGIYLLKVENKILRILIER